jgi:hypothetical protein
MLVYNDSIQLGDKILSKAERLQELRESTDRRLQPQRMADQADFTQAAARRGRVMHTAEVLRRLKRCVPRLWAADGLPGWVALHRINRQGQAEYMFAVPWGELPEYSIVHVDARNLPQREERGWRTVLIRLHRSGLLSEPQMSKAFGEPSNGVIASHFRRLLKARR